MSDDEFSVKKAKITNFITDLNNDNSTLKDLLGEKFITAKTHSHFISKGKEIFYEELQAVFSFLCSNKKFLSYDEYQNTFTKLYNFVALISQKFPNFNHKIASCKSCLCFYEQSFSDYRDSCFNDLPFDIKKKLSDDIHTLSAEAFSFFIINIEELEISNLPKAFYDKLALLKRLTEKDFFYDTVCSLSLSQISDYFSKNGFKNAISILFKYKKFLPLVYSNDITIYSNNVFQSFFLKNSHKLDFMIDAFKKLELMQLEQFHYNQFFPVYLGFEISYINSLYKSPVKQFFHMFNVYISLNKPEIGNQFLSVIYNNATNRLSFIELVKTIFFSEDKFTQFISDFSREFSESRHDIKLKFPYFADSYDAWTGLSEDIEQKNKQKLFEKLSTSSHMSKDMKIEMLTSILNIHPFSISSFSEIAENYDDLYEIAAYAYRSYTDVGGNNHDDGISSLLSHDIDLPATLKFFIFAVLINIRSFEEFRRHIAKHIVLKFFSNEVPFLPPLSLFPRTLKQPLIEISYEFLSKRQNSKYFFEISNEAKHRAYIQKLHLIKQNERYNSLCEKYLFELPANTPEAELSGSIELRNLFHEKFRVEKLDSKDCKSLDSTLVLLRKYRVPEMIEYAIPTDFSKKLDLEIFNSLFNHKKTIRNNLALDNIKISFNDLVSTVRVRIKGHFLTLSVFQLLLIAIRKIGYSSLIGLFNFNHLMKVQLDKLFTTGLLLLDGNMLLLNVPKDDSTNYIVNFYFKDEEKGFVSSNIDSSNSSDQLFDKDIFIQCKIMRIVKIEKRILINDLRKQCSDSPEFDKALNTLIQKEFLTRSEDDDDFVEYI